MVHAGTNPNWSFHLNNKFIPIFVDSILHSKIFVSFHENPVFPNLWSKVYSETKGIPILIHTSLLLLDVCSALLWSLVLGPRRDLVLVLTFSWVPWTFVLPVPLGCLLWGCHWLWACPMLPAYTSLDRHSSCSHGTVTRRKTKACWHHYS